MQNLSILFLLGCSSALAACGDDGPGPSAPDAPLVTTTITITSGQPPALIVFRDGTDSPWQAATMKTPTSFEATIHGPYLVTVVCEHIDHSWETWQAARTPDDPHELSAPCDVPPSEHAITGHMVQAGRLQLGPSIDDSMTPDWDFHLSVASGSYDLIATTDDRVEVRRGIQVEGDLAVTPPIDVAQRGTALADVAFTITNAAKDEKLVAVVGLASTMTPFSGNLYHGPIETAKFAPDSVLVATDTQSAELLASTGTSLRALRRPFRAGGKTEYTLPSPIDPPLWTIDNGRLSVISSSLPGLDAIFVSAAGSSMADATTAHHDLELSSQFLQATGVVRYIIDTDIPGYKPEWKVDFTRFYIRSLIARGTADGELSTSFLTEEVNAPPPGAPPAPRTSRARVRRI